MKNGFRAKNDVMYLPPGQENSRTVVTGGYACGQGFAICWQDGPLSRKGGAGDVEFYDRPNGAFIEDVLGACAARLEAFQRSDTACEENQRAITCIRNAMIELETRTERRTDQGTEGTLEGS